MRVAVISAYHKEPLHILRRCHESVQAQSGDVTHFMVADGFPVSDLDSWEGVVHIKLPNHADYGDTPRGVGAACAANEGFDAICFLDADNWYEPDHIETMCALAEKTGAQVVTAARRIFSVDGRMFGTCKESDGIEFCDSNCYFLTRVAFPACRAWLFKDPHDSIIGDKLFWQVVRTGGYTRSHSSRPTVNYVSAHASHYRMFGEIPPDDSKLIVQFSDSPHYQMISYAQFKAMGGLPGW